MATQAERRKQTRRKLLEAGTSVLLAQGAAGFSTVAVADAAALSNGAVFNHFSTRLDLLTATVEYALAELREGFAHEFSVAGADASATELLSILWRCMRRPEQVAVTEVFALARTNPELQQTLAPIVQEHHHHIKNMVDLMAEVQREAADSRTEADQPTGDGQTDGQNNRNGHGITVEFVESISFLFIYAMVGLTINNAAGAGVGAEDEFFRLGQHIFDAVEKQRGDR